MNDKPARKYNLSLIIGLAIPVFMVAFIGISINAPRWFNTVAPPGVDFLYLTGREDPYAQYSVVEGRLAQLESIRPDNYSLPQDIEVHFFVHDVSENHSRELQLEEVRRLQLDSSLRSPDGYSVEMGRRGGWFIFDFRPDYNSRYLVNDMYSEKLDIVRHGGRRYYAGFRFLGWVMEQ